MESVEGFYDSDEDVCYGPITLREIKRDLKQPLPNFCTIDRRRTVSYNTPPKVLAPKEEPITPDIKELVNDMSKISMQSQYFTPNETMDASSQKTSDFVDKVSRILNDSVSEPVNSYFTASNTTPEKDEFAKRETIDFDVIRTDAQHIVYQNVHTEIYKRNITCVGLQVNQSCIIDNFQATLIDNSELNGSNDEMEQTVNKIIQTLDKDEANFMENQKRFQGFQSKYDDISDVYDDKDSLHTSRNFDQSLHYNSQCYSDDSNDLNTTVNSTETDLGGNKSASPVLENYTFESQSNESIETNKLSEMNEHPTIQLESLNNSLENGNNESKDLNLINSYDSLENSGLSCLDDTFAAVDRIMQSGKKKSLEHLHQDVNTGLSTNKLVNKTTKAEKKTSKLPKLRTPQTNCYDNIISPVSAYIRQPMSKSVPQKDNLFKIPQNKPKTPLSIKSFNNYDSVQSPVAVYIKSATTPLQQKAASNRKAIPTLIPKIYTAAKNSDSKMGTSDTKADTKENICILPSGVTYKPSKIKMVRSKEDGAKLPAYIDKLIKQKPLEVIKHHMRIGVNGEEIEARTRVLSSDADLTHMNDTQLEENISIISSKKQMIN